MTDVRSMIETVAWIRSGAYALFDFDEYRPDQAELDLAEEFIATLADQGYRIAPGPKPRNEPHPDPSSVEPDEVTRSQVQCPRERSFMTPCIARDGALALADDNTCVGCGIEPVEALADLADRYPPARSSLKHPARIADRLATHVRAYITRKDDDG